MSRVPTNQQIEARAYEIYLERGGESGRELDDWLSAEKELSQRHEEIEAIFEQEKPETAKLGYAATASSRRK
jgi:hypothetical protein